jgi:hypothetical protein
MMPRDELIREIERRRGHAIKLVDVEICDAALRGLMASASRNASRNRRGRPPIGERAITPAERQRRHRARRRRERVP